MKGPHGRSAQRSRAQGAPVAGARRVRAIAGGAACVLVAVLWCLSGGVKPAAWTGAAQAQAQRVVITVASVVQATPASTVRLPIQVGPPDALAKNAFVRVRGLPPAAALSEGHAIAPGAWAVPLVALPTLTIVLPAGVQGRADVHISVVSVDGNVLAETSIALQVGPPTPTPAARPEVPAAVIMPALPAPAPRRDEPVPLPPAERERALGLHAKGVEQLERGNVYAARKFFERATDVGLAQSAVALAGTYDPGELAKLRVLGLQPDVEAARKWYEKARELGAAEATDRLRRLGAR